MQAELRANVFLALEENASTKETLMKNDELSAFIQVPLGALVMNLVREFLEFFGLDFTLSVFDPETKYGKEYNSIAREKMMAQLNITECKKKNPLLYEIVAQLALRNEEDFTSKTKNERNGDVHQVNHTEATTNSECRLSIPSPGALNVTYVKSKPEETLTPVSIHQGKLDKEEDIDESIDEDLMSNKSG